MNLRLLITISLFTLCSCKSQTTLIERENADNALSDWHAAAATANFDSYFNLMTKNSIFIGTDATEKWNKKSFKTYAKPHFDKGRAWSFKKLERSIYVNPSDNTTAWFDELLSTQMGICRGSGVLKKEGKQWKIQHYVLSISVPNQEVSKLTLMKKEWDSLHIKNKY